MNREDVHKLLGGYATGTLTPEEQQALFEAALEDQELFDALAREQALHDVLGDPAARAHLLAALDEPPRLSWFQRWWRPMLPITVAAMAALVIAVVTHQPSEPADPRPVKMARLEPLPLPVTTPMPMLPPPPVVAPPTPRAAPFSMPAAVPPPPPPPPAARPAADSASLNKVEVQGSAVAVPPPAAAPREVPKSTTISGQPGVQGSLGGFVPAARSGFVAGTVPVRGVVLDPTGAGVPSATVEVKSLATGEIARVSTNTNGEFTAPGLPGAAYDIRASAPGFKIVTISNAVIPATGLIDPLKIQLQVGSVSESVVVSGLAKRPPTAAGGRGGGGGGRATTAARSAPAPAAPQTQAAPSAQQGQAGQPMQDFKQQQMDALGSTAFSVNGAVVMPIRYRLRRKVAHSDPVDIGGDGLVNSGADVILEVTARFDGFVRVMRTNGRDIAPHVVLASQPYEIPLGKFTKKGRVDLQLMFSTEPFEAKKKTQAVASAGPAPTQTQIDIAINVR